MLEMKNQKLADLTEVFRNDYAEMTSKEQRNVTF